MRLVTDFVQDFRYAITNKNIMLPVKEKATNISQNLDEGLKYASSLKM